MVTLKRKRETSDVADPKEGEGFVRGEREKPKRDWQKRGGTVERGNALRREGAILEVERGKKPSAGRKIK